MSHAEKIDAHKVRGRSASFFDHFTQAALFFRSQSDVEKEHLVQALRFELSKVERAEIRTRMLGVLSHVDRDLARRVAEGLGMPVPKELDGPLNHSVPADGVEADFQPRLTPKRMPPSPALSMANKANSKRGGIKTRKIAILAADGVAGRELSSLAAALSAAGATAVVVGTRVGSLTTDTGKELKIDASLLNTGSVLYDAVFVPGGKRSVRALLEEPRAVRFVKEAFGHAKAIGASGEGAGLLAAAGIAAGAASLPPGVVVAAMSAGNAGAKSFIEAVAAHRHWEREERPVRPIARR